MSAARENVFGGESLRNKHPGAHAALLPSGGFARLVAEAPEIIKAQNAPDGASRILSDDGTREVKLRPVLLRINHEGRAQTPAVRVDSH